MANVSYTSKPNYVSKKGPVKVMKNPVDFSKFKNTTKMPKPVKVPKNGFAGPGNPNEVPKYRNMKKTLQKKGLQTNYSK